MRRVLVVDDSSVDRELIAGLLEEESGFEVLTASNGREALDVLARGEPELVVTDLAMPVMCGLELVQEMARRHPTVPVILVTSQGSEEAASNALRLGASSYVPKSRLADQLAEVADQLVAAVLERRARHAVLSSVEQGHVVFLLPNDREAFPPLIAFVQELVAGLGVCDEAGLMRLAVALEEALVNAAEHGNLEMDSKQREDDRLGYVHEVRRRRETEPWKDRRVRFELRFATDEIRLTIHDQGEGFDPHGLPDPTDPQNLLKASGRGVLLMRTFMDEVSYNDSGNQVTMVKRRPTGAQEPAEG